jgi:Holliday junction DNA helicase RuvB
MDRIVTNSTDPVERDQEAALRPRSFAEYVGQEKVVANISVMVESAKIRGAAMDHVLLSGPPGLGKPPLRC